MVDQKSGVSLQATVGLSEDGRTIQCCGSWVLAQVTTLENQIEKVLRKAAEVRVIDVAQLALLDTAGALLIHQLTKKLNAKGQTVLVGGLMGQHRSLFDLVEKETKKIHGAKKSFEKNWMYRVGLWAVDKWQQMVDFLAFTGEVSVTLVRSALVPKRIHWRSVLVAMEQTGYDALPIVALMSFLIGVVLAYQLGEQLKIYGANIFIADVTGIAILREFSPLITAIIVAGRTSTSFSALIGTMKVNEEIDALRTMGLSPIERLVLPRIFGLVVALPLLIVWSDIFGILGSMVMANYMLDINYYSFLERLQEAVALKHYVLGLIKAPFFAVVIASVGCFQGFQVGSSADSVGQKTTQSAVQAIFLIIITDAAFSIVYSWMGL